MNICIIFFLKLSMKIFSFFNATPLPARFSRFGKFCRNAVNIICPQIICSSFHYYQHSTQSIETIYDRLCTNMNLLTQLIMVTMDVRCSSFWDILESFRISKSVTARRDCFGKCDSETGYRYEWHNFQEVRHIFDFTGDMDIVQS